MDKLSKKILKFIEDRPDHTIFFPNYQGGVDYPRHFGVSYVDFHQALRRMIADEVLDAIKGDSNNLLGVTLSYRQVHKREFRRIDFLKYLKVNYLAIIGTIIAVVAFIRTF